MKIFVVALLSVASTAIASGAHNHKHRHLNRNDEKRGSPVEMRATMVTETLSATETVYKLQNGEDLTYAEVEEGIKDGKYVLINDEVESAPAIVPSTAAAVPSTTAIPTTTVVPTSSSVAEAAEFNELSTSSSSSSVVPTTSAAPTTSSTPVAPTTSSTSVAKSSSVAAASPTDTSSTSTSSSSASKIGEDFPSGELDCSSLPTDYGAVYVDWLGLDGWTGIQQTPNYSPGDLSISYISEAVSGGCTEGSFCSYACPPGYQKSQWPVAQGSTGQSIGGLYCNSNGKLEISNTNFSTICIEGTGSISVKNTLSEQVVICRTDYPGTESETVPLVNAAGSTNPLTCPDAATYYTWEGSETSAQYYLNPKGATEAEACVWGSAGTDLGNWAPLNLGVGMDKLGVTYISLIPNSPTNPDGVLDYTVTIKGDTSGTCYYSDGKFYDDDGENSSGCTVEVSGTAYYELS